MLFNEKFKEATLLEHERFTAHASSMTETELEKENEGNESYLLVMLVDWAEQDTLVSLLETFKEYTENKISNYESVINSEITKDWKETEARIV